MSTPSVTDLASEAKELIDNNDIPFCSSKYFYNNYFMLMVSESFSALSTETLDKNNRVLDTAALTAQIKECATLN